MHMTRRRWAAGATIIGFGIAAAVGVAVPAMASTPDPSGAPKVTLVKTDAPLPTDVTPGTLTVGGPVSPDALPKGLTTGTAPGVTLSATDAPLPTDVQPGTLTAVGPIPAGLGAGATTAAR